MDQRYKNIPREIPKYTFQFKVIHGKKGNGKE